MPGEASYHFDNILEEDDDGDNQYDRNVDEERSYLVAIGAVLPRWHKTRLISSKWASMLTFQTWKYANTGLDPFSKKEIPV